MIRVNQLVEDSERAGHDRDAKIDYAKCFTQCDGLIFLAGRFFDKKMFQDFLQLCIKYFSRMQECIYIYIHTGCSQTVVPSFGRGM